MFLVLIWWFHGGWGQNFSDLILNSVKVVVIWRCSGGASSGGGADFGAGGGDCDDVFGGYED